MPPGAGGPLSTLGNVGGLLRDPTAFLSRRRDKLGDTFVVDAAGHRLLCVFSPQGIHRLYAFPENEASFGLATFELIRRKVPDELFVGRRNTPHDLFGRQETERYLGNLDEAMAMEIDSLGGQGRFEIFAEARRLGHRLGLGSWAGVEAASPRYLDRLVPLFDRLDASEAFVRPARTLLTTATGKVLERRAMHGIEAVVAEIWAARQARGIDHDDFLAQLYRSFDDLPPADRDVQVARDLILIHMGSQSNLYAALAWTLVHVLQDGYVLAAVRAGEPGVLERCAYESIRLAQRSITLRQVLRPVELDDGHQTYRVEPGVMITTMLSVTNTTAAADLDHFDPAHYQGRRLAPTVVLPTKEVVSTFGHGIHTCPAQRFSISAIVIAVRALVEHFDLEPRFTNARPRARQIGGVARAARPCVVTYRRRPR
jgi:cytochrome P450